MTFIHSGLPAACLTYAGGRALWGKALWNIAEARNTNRANEPWLRCERCIHSLVTISKVGLGAQLGSAQSHVGDAGLEAPLRLAEKHTSERRCGDRDPRRRVLG